MKRKNATKQQPNTIATSPVLVETKRFDEHMAEHFEAIAARAFEFFESRGREHGHSLEDWLRAEAELRQSLPIEIAESDNQLTARAEVSGFSADELKVSVEPRRLLISGQKQRNSLQRCAKTVFGSLYLPAEIDPAKVTVTLQDGILSLILPKTTTHVSIQRH
jgi:HSP20 family molecular chaperone IbpA